MSTEHLILKNLIHNEEYARTALPYLNAKYFSNNSEKVVFEEVAEFIGKYNTLPTREALTIELDERTNLSDKEYNEIAEYISTLTKEVDNQDQEWLIDTTEKFCQEKALYNAIMDSIHIIDNKDGKEDKGSIPQILTEALSVSFDPYIGHDFIEDAQKRYEFYHKKEERVPFDLEYLNKITKGGLPKKSLSVLMAGCVHPNTKVKIRFRKPMVDWIEKETEIKEIQKLLDAGYEVEVDSPDGWVGVNFFIDKGMYDKYTLDIDGEEIVRCNAEHLFETTIGWVSARQIESTDGVNVLCEDGSYKFGKVYKSNQQIPIVDINVNHKNHRYYTNGISSHNTGVGKSLAMCHFASANILDGKNVLYITMEMAEERIAERIDANLLNVTMDELHQLPAQMYAKKIEKVKGKTSGKLIIKEYPTSSAGVGHFRHLLNELKLKTGFKPDIIYIDYLNICASSRMRMGASVNSYTYVKAIAEEIRGLAVEQSVPIVTATQVNRTGYGDSDFGLEDTSESFGLPATTDLMLALISTEELENLNQILIKQLKNRYGDPGTYKRFTVGIDRPKMRLYDLEQNAQEDLMDSPLHDHDHDLSHKHKDFSGITV